MTRRPAFTLVELIIAILIFSYMSASLVTIYGTSHRHMSQNYRGDRIKTNAIVGMRAVQNNLISANRIDLPLANASGNVLRFAVNIDGQSGCVPINPSAATSWHYFCLANDPLTPGFDSLYYHTGTLNPDPATACGTAAPVILGNTYPTPACGAAAAGQTMYKLMQYVDTRNGLRLFSRASADGVDNASSVRVRLGSFWPAAAPGLGGVQRDIQFMLDTVVSANSAR